MLEEGTQISYKLPEEEKSVTGTVKSCNRRGTSCVVELRPGETRTINLNRATYKVLEAAASQSSSDEEPGMSPQERGPNGNTGREGEEGSKDEAAEEESGDEELGSGSEQQEADDSQEEGLDGFDADTSRSLATFCAAASKPAAFKKPSADLAGLARLAAKALYDHTAAAQKAEALLPELHVDGFDAEQIWSQLEASTSAAIRQLRKRMRKLGPEVQLLTPEAEADLQELLEAREEGADSSDLEDGGGTAKDESADEGDQHDSQAEEEEEEASEDEEDREAEDDDSAELLPTEDRFMRLADMEKFVQDAEEAAMKENADEDQVDSGDEEDSSEDDDEDDLEVEEDAEDMSSDEEQLERLLESAAAMTGAKSKQGKRSGAADGSDGIMYEDFFGQRKGGRRQASDDEELLDPQSGSDAGSVGESMDEGSEPEAASEEEDEAPADFWGSQKPPSPEAAVEADENLSAHQRRLLRVAERARRLEEENLGEKEWYMTGEAGAGSRPLNSALEIDLDFERGLRPPPPPTEEATTSLEDLIKQRIADRSFDDPARAAPPPPDLQKELAELDDKRSSKGLEEVYAEEFVAARAGGAVEDKDDKKRKEAKMLLAELMAKLDALSHFHFAPKPVIEDLTVRKEVPALAMEEVAPQVVSEAARQLPQEVYAPPKNAAAKAEEELTHEERRRRRAAKKRGLKKQAEQQAAERKAMGIVEDGNVVIAGRKSAAQDAADVAARKAAKLKRKRAKRSADADAPRVKFTKSSQVFAQIEASKAAGKRQKPSAAADGLKSSTFKL